MATPSIQKSLLADAPALVQLEIRCFPGDRLSLRQYRYLINRQSALVLTMKQRGKVIGGAVVLFRKGSSKARLYSIAIDPACQGRGFGDLLLSAVEREVKSHRATSIQLEVRHDNQGAIHFYLKHGYVIVGEYAGFYEDGARAIRMYKLLDGS